MDSKLETLLMTKFPEYLGNLEYFGRYIECENGWFVPLFQFLQEMQVNKLVFSISCIKEKFGSMRVYPALRHYPFNDESDSKVLDDKVWEAINRLQARSATVCEFCGEAGELRWEWGWVRTLCNKCNSTYDKISHRRTLPWEDYKPMRSMMILPEEIRKTMAPPKL